MIQKIIYKKNINNIQDLSNFENIIHKYDYKLENEMTEKLTVFANKFLKKYFDVELYAKICFNNSLKQTNGRTIISSTLSKNDWNKIELSGELLNLSSLDPKKYDYLYDILRHELVHYALYILNKDYNDGSKDFENTLHKLNICSSGSTDYKKFKNSVREYRTYVYMKNGLIYGWYRYEKDINKKYPEYTISKIMVIKEELN